MIKESLQSRVDQVLQLEKHEKSLIKWYLIDQDNVIQVHVTEILEPWLKKRDTIKTLYWEYEVKFIGQQV